ncbi:MAG: prepilin-type N-terminal cleavage/methylation domain-containing protein [Fibrobacteres bacterium]|nr:prepilin-type N-terminal cleavage/methylation domain-containing protein [Fibrobacterota bacterium]
MDYLRKCISGEKGMTLVEVSAALVIMSLAVAGLGSVYVMAVREWRDTALQIRGQQAGTDIMEEVVRSLQAASSVEVQDNRMVAYYKISDLNIDSTVTFNRSGATLQKNGKTVFPTPGIEPLSQNDIQIKDFKLIEPVKSDSLYRLILTLTLQYRDYVENIDYSTAFCLRNSLSEANSAPAGMP